MGELIPFQRRRPLPAGWQAYTRRGGAARVRMMIWAGLLLGLLFFQVLRLVPEAEAPKSETALIPAPAPPSPYAEAERSREILEGQEGSPAPALLPVPGPGSTTGEGEGESEGGSGTPIAGPVHVIDGDTFAYGGMRVRIADIDAPEVNGRCFYETQLSARATRRLRVLLAAGPFELHRLPDGRDTDRYGRQLRIVTRNGRSVGDQLVAEGLARTWTGRREPWCV